MIQKRPSLLEQNLGVERNQIPDCSEVSLERRARLHAEDKKEVISMQCV